MRHRSATNLAYSAALLSSSGNRSRNDGCTVANPGSSPNAIGPRSRVTDTARCASAFARRASERDHEPRLHRRDFALEPPAARGDLARIRLLVDAPFSARLILEVLHRIGDVKRGAIETGLGDRAIEQLAGRADERPARESPDRRAVRRRT